MTTMISEAAGLACILAIRGRFEADGPDAPLLTVWAGEAPATAETDVDADTNAMLVEFPLAGTVFGDPQREGDVLVCDLLPVGGATGQDEGEASFYRLYDREGNAVMQGDVGLEGSGADLEIDDIEIATQKLVTVKSLRLALPLGATP